MENSINLMYPKTPYQQDTLEQVMSLVCMLPLKEETVKQIKEDLKYEEINPIMKEIRRIGSTFNQELANKQPPNYIK